MTLRNKAAFIPFAISLVILSPECAGIKNLFQKPTIKLESVKVTNVDLAGCTLRITASIDNPNPIGLTINSFDYKLRMNGEDLLEGSKKDAIKIRSRDKSPIVLNVKVKYSGLRGGIAGILRLRELPYEFRGKINIATPIGDIPFDIEHKGKVPIPAPPRFSIDKVVIKSLGFLSTRVIFHIKVAHTKDTKLDIKKFQYRIAVNGIDVSRYGREFKKRVVADGFIVPLAVDMRLKDLGRSLIKAIVARRFSYRVEFSLHLSSQYGPYKLDYDKSGST